MIRDSTNNTTIYKGLLEKIEPSNPIRFRFPGSGHGNTNEIQVQHQSAADQELYRRHSYSIPCYRRRRRADDPRTDL